MFNLLKSFLRDTMALPPGLVLVVLGLIAHLLLCLILRKPLYSAWGLLATGILGLLIEGYEIWIHYRDIGLLAPGNDPLAVILLRHSVDILQMMLFPLILVIMGNITHPTN